MYYYESIHVQATDTGYYRFRSDASFGTYGYIYENTFSPWNPTEHLLAYNDNRCGHGQFEFGTSMQANTTYILVVTTDLPNETGPFLIMVYGANSVTFNRIREYLYYYFI